MRLVLAGTPTIALPTLEALVGSAHEVVAVLTRPDAPRGRSKRPVPSPVAAWAEERGLRVLKPSRPGDPEAVAALTALRPDACPVVAYGALVPEHALAIPRYGWVNLHFSLLPRWRGAAPVQRALMAGDEVTGATTFRLVKQLDAGPVYGTLIEQLDGTETAGEVLTRLAEEGAGLLLDTLDLVPTTEPVEQDPAGVTLAPKVTVAEARLDWARDGRELERLIRACSPRPMAWTTLDGVRLKVALAHPLPTAELDPGEVRVEKHRVLAGTGSIDLELLQVQPDGKRVLAAPAWGRGLRAERVRFV